MWKFLLLILIFCSCNQNRQEKKEIIYSLKEMSDLATVEYTVTKIIKASDNNTWFKVGTRKILMSCEAQIKAGIDMSSISEKDFDIDGKDVRVKLPEPKLISLNIPAEKIHVEYQNVSLFRDQFSTAERDQLAAQAETSIRNSIDSLGILQQAKINTSLFISNLLQRLGYRNISITYDEVKASKKLG